MHFNYTDGKDFIVYSDMASDEIVIKYKEKELLRLPALEYIAFVSLCTMTLQLIIEGLLEEATK